MLNRELIDYEFSNIKDIIFLNISSVVVPPKCVQDAYFNFMKQYVETYSKTAVSDGWKIVNSARKNVAKLINAKPLEIAFVKNTSEGMGIIANGLALKPGDNIIVFDQEFPANLYAWINLQSKGVELSVVRSKEDKIVIDDIVDVIDRNTKVIAISAVQFTTGFYIELMKLGEICKANNIIFVVDGIQAVGRLNIDVKEMNISYLVCGGYKGLLSTFGAGFVFCDSAIINDITPLSANHQSVINCDNTFKMPKDFSKIEWHEDSRRLEAGNLDFAGIAAIDAGVKLINELGIREIEKHVLQLQQELIQNISHLPIKFKTPLEKENYSGILSIYYPRIIEKEVKEIIEKYKIVATVKDNYIRIGVNFYNTKEQMIKVAEAFDEAANIIYNRFLKCFY
ncbi:aminotransferase class V-fold PLP-dependent enzyme [Clostridium ganghwense]|uniref:Aminotransferase class V-fold PLP-dependent enzyme n=1 Tax=Clostridium ganghwense TaxID=312089 RepID=A0ABT4CP83_9CLOT|nr:aminotransferase class V-fold PLP-dependent enzyme [Clostridium ganghwense]MCY6370867.1 aminotransferase class V-fold PLP-dependent enzyme [Clostridium ganghwense]